MGLGPPRGGGSRAFVDTGKRGCYSNPPSPGEDREEDVPAAPQEPPAHPRVPQTHEDPRRTRGAAPPPPQGAKAAHRLRGEEVARPRAAGPSPGRKSGRRP